MESIAERRRPVTSSTNSDDVSVTSQASNPSAKPTRQKFTPQLIDTAKRTRKAGDIQPAHLLSDRTDAMPDIDGIGRFRQRILHPPPNPSNTIIDNNNPVMTSAEARRLGIPLPKRQFVDCNIRQHSFQVPELDPILSSESDEDSSSPPSRSSSTSDFSYQMYKHATRMRESIDATSSGYLLELAAKAAEKQLRDQALAAFPNDDHHTPVDHWIGRDSEEHTAMNSHSELDRQRFGSIDWDLNDLRKHREEIEAQKEMELQARETRRSRNNKQGDTKPWSNPFSRVPVSPKAWKKDAEMERMRRKARPPMLGNDIEFPRCASPTNARFDVTQGSYSVRTAMCYLTEQTESDDCKESLWSPKPQKGTAVGSLWSQPSSRAPSPGGLWAGCCLGSNLTPPRGPTGLMTPRVDDEAPNPLEAVDTSKMLHHLPPSPPPSNSGMASLDEKLEIEQRIEQEFDDAFVTQVYNYISLGVSSLAHSFDEELSKISRVPILELRIDDNLASTRGYIRLGEDECGKEDGIREEMCARWKALRIYIHEWARQQSRMSSPQPNLGGFGVLARRGSWAW
jgi:hypothetical protein